MKTKEAVCKRIILSIFFLLVLCRTAGAQDSQKATLTAADAGTCSATSTACLVINIPSGSGGATFNIGANASANTVQFEASADYGATWVALSVTPSSSTTTVTSTTSTGAWQANVAGYTKARMRCSTFVGGTTTTYINLSTASARAGGGGYPGITSPGTGSLTGTGTATFNIGSFNSVGTNFEDMPCAAQSVGNSNQVRYYPDGTCWPVVSMNTNAAQKLALSMGVNAQTISYLATQSDCGKLITMNGVSLTFTLPAAIINSACVFDVKNLAATSLTIARNGLNVDGAASNPTALTQNQSYRITNDGAGYWTEALQISTAAPVSSVFTRTGAVVAAANDYTLDQIGNPVAAVSFQPTVDAGILIKQSNTTNTADIFHIQNKGGTELFRLDNNSVMRLQNGNATINSSGVPSFPLYGTASNCANGASPAVCVAAAAGAVAVPTGTNPTLVINTTAVTANSRIFMQIDESLTIAATTCNTTLSTLVQPVVTARTAGTSFTIQIGAVIATNPACVSYFIMD